MNKGFCKQTYKIKSKNAELFLVEEKIKTHEIYYLLFINNKICLVEIFKENGIFNVYIFYKKLSISYLLYRIDNGFYIRDLVYKNKYLDFLERE